MEDFDFFKEIIESAIEKMVKHELGIESSKLEGNDIVYKPVWRLSQSKQKTLSYLMMKKNNDKSYKRIDTEILDATGATWEEIVEFMKKKSINKVPAKIDAI